MRNRTLTTYYVYILASWTRTLYIGVTNDLERRLHEHRTDNSERSFTSRYKITRLVYIEEFDNINDALDREKQLKKWNREKKERLIESQNPTWQDLSEGWFPCDRE